MFSGIVKIADIDDYITPSQNCIKPIQEGSGKIKFDMNEKKLVLEKPDLIKKDVNNAAKVSLTDCLACSGCVTTAETLLIQAQSVDEFLKNLKEARVPVVCISPQSVLSLANYYGIDEVKAFERLCCMLQEAGVRYIVNYDSAVSLALDEAYTEWENKSTQFIICSECPGWICYAEKKVGEWIMPFLSKVKSPQQIIGHVVKTLFREKFDTDIYLAAIMPCFDKKLEASRENHKVNNVFEVDTVLSTNELIELFQKLEVGFEKQNDREVNIFYTFNELVNGLNPSNDFKQFFITDVNFSSNGYSEYIMKRYIEKNILTDCKIERKVLKNVDMREINLVKDDKIILSFCLVYGFRNIQNILRNKTKIKYSYLEIMACPGGCINGGGQFKPKDSEKTPRDVLKTIEDTVIKSEKKVSNEDEKIILKSFIKENIFTQYKALENTTVSLKW